MNVSVPDYFWYIVELSFLSFAIGLIVGYRRRREPLEILIRNKKDEAEQRRRKQQAQQLARDTHRDMLEIELGLSKALTAKFYSRLKRSLGSGEVKVALVSDKCPNGYVAFDFIHEDWVCIERDGSSYQLGGRPAGELIELEEEGGESDGG